jgi:uncharacterized membrane protein
MSTPALYMDAVIRPNRSLSPRGFAVVIGSVAFINLLTATFFLSIGATPIPVFLGLDLLAIFVALKLSYRAARTAERVQVTAEEVRVRHESPRGGRTVWKSPTAFTRVALETLGDDNLVRLQLSGRRLTVGSALSPRERRDFGRALEAAVGRARAERWP